MKYTNYMNNNIRISKIQKKKHDFSNFVGVFQTHKILKRSMSIYIDDIESATIFNKGFKNLDIM